MTKAEISKSISRKTGIETCTVQMVIEELMEEIKKSVCAGESVYLRGFGTFGLKHRAQKIGRNIKKKTSVVIPESDIPCFKPCPEFKNFVKHNE